MILESTECRHGGSKLWDIAYDVRDDSVDCQVTAPWGLENDIALTDWPSRGSLKPECAHLGRTCPNVFCTQASAILIEQLQSLTLTAAVEHFHAERYRHVFQAENLELGTPSVPS